MAGGGSAGAAHPVEGEQRGGDDGLLVLQEVTPQAVGEQRINVDLKERDRRKRANNKILKRLKKNIREKKELEKNRINYLPVDPKELPQNLPNTKKIKNKKMKLKLSRDVRLAILSSKKLLANKKFKRVEEGFIRVVPAQDDLRRGGDPTNEEDKSVTLKKGKEVQPSTDDLAGARSLLTQKELYARADVGTKKKVMDLRLNLGPYQCRYSRNGKYLLSTGEKGHITLMDTHNLEPMCEFQVDESIRCSTILHNHKLFAVAQKKYIYLYDNTGIEINCIKDILYSYQMEFLPFHFLLTSIGEFGELVYQDISVGSIITRKKTKRGPCKIMKQNKQDATIYLGHTNGHVTVWTPNIDKPVCDIYCHATPISTLTVHKNYLITSSVDCTYKLWDMRKLEFIESKRSHNVINEMEVSDTGVVAIAMNSHFRTYKDFFTNPQLYLTHNTYGDKINSLSFQPFEDICCVGARYSIKSLLVPGAGLANIDTYVNNPYETKKQVRENEIRSLLDKLPPDTITFVKNQLGRINPFASNARQGKAANSQSFSANEAVASVAAAAAAARRKGRNGKGALHSSTTLKHQTGDSSEDETSDGATGGGQGKMTTAHRPTWYNAIGGENQGGNRKVSQTAKVCSRDLPGHTKMKTRDLSDYVEDKEVIKNNLIQLEGGTTDKDNSHRLLAIENIKKLTNHDYTNPFPEDEDDEVEEEWKSRRRKEGKKAKRKNSASRRAKGDSQDGSQQGSQSGDDISDDPSEDQSNESSEDRSDDSSDDESEDEEEKELLRELENLKREKMEKERQEKQEQELLQSRKNNVLTNNPLINLEDNSDNEEGEGMSRKRKWTEEAIFRNTCEKKEKKITFINDTVRTAFHKKFLFKYIH
ncbi:hypothetical protein AK88_02465 [Plasmodium fragile]|uniref:BING4 C-terminal domain-containing protein n=1 Tax=Plasmodium fragile TaxID=5857 RepID=A0A0D9QQ92_PLAFR|nr:uncharacterized protein AK88_02465 [Plasmodium fragile]KJP87861.1 hypothetical protein AK88_02465 [Plasmodium fragile]